MWSVWNELDPNHKPGLGVQEDSWFGEAVAAP